MRGGGDGRRLLLVSEAVTLAHLARPLSLSNAIGSRWSVTLACDPRYHRFLGAFGGTVLPLPSVEPHAFLSALRRGAPLYDESTLERYVKDDLRVISSAKPDLIVGDFRLSLSISARVAGVPYAAISNAYWSPYYEPENWPVPQLPLTRAAPIRLAEVLFRVTRPLAFGWHTRPLNSVRRLHGLRPLGYDLRRVYTDADYVFYADVPEMFPLKSTPDSHQFIGAPLWEPPAPFPEWWAEIPDDRPLIYATLGSSGQASLLPAVLEGLASLESTILVATAGGVAGRGLLPNVRAAEFLPGLAVCRHASLVICNGGSLTCYQALAAGVPVIGISGNLDQFLNMQALERVGAGVTIRADRLTPDALKRAAKRLLSEQAFKANAQQVAHWCASRPFAARVTAALDDVTAHH